MIEGIYDSEIAQQQLRAAQERAIYNAMSEKDLAREIKLLEKDMLAHAKNLEFEQAAESRDQLKRLKQQLFGVEMEDPLASRVAELKPVSKKSSARRRAV
jgi:excinuclease ABC subunit B